MSDIQKKSLHPLIAVAAGSVIVFSLVGVAAMTGLLPNSNGEPKADVDHRTVSVGDDTKASANSNATTLVVDQADKTSDTQVTKSPSTAKVEKKPVEQKAAQKSSPQNSSTTTAEKNEKLICNQCGVIESVRSVEQKAEKGSGVGAVAGAVLGGVIGNQIGGGNGRKLATVAGAVGGGYAGNEIEKSRNTRTTYEVRVKMENGDIRTFTPENKPEWRSGDRVKLVDGRLVSND
jgi:outer membrane lipoprotein SlyB